MAVEEPAPDRGLPVAYDVRALIRELSAANPLWGAPRIHGELLKLGISVTRRCLLGQRLSAVTLLARPPPDASIERAVDALTLAGDSQYSSVTDPC